MIFNGDRTIYNIKFQNSKMFNLPYKPLSNTTINEKLNILSGYQFGDIKEYPELSLNLLIIGSYGTEVNGDNTRYNLKSSKHSPIDAALFRQIPFYLRKTSEVSKYPVNPNLRLKKKLFINGEEHIAYYGYKISEVIHKKDIIEFNNIDKEYTNIKKFSTNKDMVLNPKPIKDLRMDMSINRYIGDFVKVYTFLSSKDIAEILNAAKILYPKENISEITEIGLCHGHEVELEDTSKEMVWSQISYFVDCLLDLNDGLRKNELSFYIEIGGMEILNVKD